MNFLPITIELTNSPAVSASEFLAGVCTTTLAIYPEAGPVFPWVGYLVKDSDTFIGACAFKTPPINDTVEIAYLLFQSLREKELLPVWQSS